MNHPDQKINVPYMLGEISSDIKSIQDMMRANNEWLKNHERRLGDVESFQANQQGAARVWGLVSGAATSIILFLAQAFFGARK